MSRLSPEQSCEPKSGLGPGRQAERERDSLSSTVVSQTSPSSASHQVEGGLAVTETEQI